MNPSLMPPVFQPDANAIGIDLICQKMQAALSELFWLGSHSLGRIHPQMTEDGKLLPWLFKGQTGEYYSAFPNDQLDSFSCLLAHDDEQYNENGYFADRTVSVIVWVNLSKQAGSPRTIEPLKWDVINTLTGIYEVLKPVRSFDQATSGGDKIYPGFDLAGLRTKYMTWPYGAFRSEFLVTYPKPCSNEC